MFLITHCNMLPIISMYTTFLLLFVLFINGPYPFFFLFLYIVSKVSSPELKIKIKVKIRILNQDSRNITNKAFEHIVTSSSKLTKIILNKEGKKSWNLTTCMDRGRGTEKSKEKMMSSPSPRPSRQVEIAKLTWWSVEKSAFQRRWTQIYQLLFNHERKGVKIN